jgi:hypothetical protein
MAFTKVINRVIGRGKRVELRRALDSRKHHLNDAGVISVMFPEESTRIKQSARLPELNHIWVVSTWIKSLFVLRPPQLAAEGVFSTGESLYKTVRFVRHRSVPRV